MENLSKTPKLIKSNKIKQKQLTKTTSKTKITKQKPPEVNSPHKENPIISAFTINKT